MKKGRTKIKHTQEKRKYLKTKRSKLGCSKIWQLYLKHSEENHLRYLPYFVLNDFLLYFLNLAEAIFPPLTYSNKKNSSKYL